MGKTKIMVNKCNHNMGKISVRDNRCILHNMDKIKTMVNFKCSHKELRQATNLLQVKLKLLVYIFFKGIFPLNIVVFAVINLNLIRKLKTEENYLKRLKMNQVMGGQE